MQILVSFLVLSGASFWVLLLGSWYSPYVQRCVAAYLIARAGSIETQRLVMKAEHKDWKNVLLNAKEHS